MMKAAMRVALRTAISRPSIVLTLVGASIAAAGWVGAQVTFPFVVARIIDQAIFLKRESLLISGAGLLVAVALVSVSCKAAHKLAFTWIAELTLVEVRSELLAHLQAMPLAAHDRHDSGTFSALFTDDAPAVGRIWDPMLGEALLAVVQLTAIVWMIIAKYGAIAWVIVVLIPTYVALPLLIGPRVRHSA